MRLLYRDPAAPTLRRSFTFVVIEIAVESDREVLPRPDARNPIQRGCVPNVEIGLIADRTVPLVEQPALVLAGLTIATSTSNFWSESYGNIYPVLKKLLVEGAIRAEHGDVQQGSRQKQLYGITASGRQMLEDWLRQPVVPRPEDNELLLKLFFSALLSPAESHALLRAFREHHTRLLDWLATLRCGEAVSRALIKWCDATDGELQKLKS